MNRLDDPLREKWLRAAQAAPAGGADSVHGNTSLREIAPPSAVPVRRCADVPYDVVCKQFLAGMSESERRHGSVLLFPPALAGRASGDVGSRRRRLALRRALHPSLAVA